MSKHNKHNAQLAEVIRAKAHTLDDPDATELLRVLARILDGKPPLKAFGAPGDWGYDTPIGDALYDCLRHRE